MIFGDYNSGGRIYSAILGLNTGCLGFFILDICHCLIITVVLQNYKCSIGFGDYNSYLPYRNYQLIFLYKTGCHGYFMQL